MYLFLDRHPSHWGRVCFLSTPDGENCGLIKNLSGTGLVSLNTKKSITPTLFRCGMENLVDNTSTSFCGKYRIFLDGEWVGVCEDSLSFVTNVRRKRRRNPFLHQVISLNNSLIDLYEISNYFFKAP